MRTTVDVAMPGSPYRVMIERGGLRTLGRVVQAVAPDRRALLAVDERIADDHGLVAERSLRDAGIEPVVHRVVALESRKTLDTVRVMYDVMLAARLQRSSPVVALGGGIVGDVAGFAAATYLRGVPLVQVPSTLLAMVDAAIGGKTGVNHPLPGGGPGKNLVGAFWQPRAVLCDPDLLATLDTRDLRCGLAECVKHGVIADARLFAAIESRANDLAAARGVSVDLIEAAVRVKAQVVAEDERESGRRALLNLGHTFAHAIEPIAELDLRHGEAVAIGLCAATHCALATGRLDAEAARRIRTLLEDLGLPVRLPSAVPTAPLVEAMRYDKKVAADRLRLVLPVAIGAAVVVDDVPTTTIVEAWRTVGASPVDP